MGAKLRPFAISALGGYGPDAMVAVSEMTHPGDELLLGEPGERWEASTTVFNTRLHRHHLIQAAAVAFWAATYDAVQSVANGDPVSLALCLFVRPSVPVCAPPGRVQRAVLEAELWLGLFLCA